MLDRLLQDHATIRIKAQALLDLLDQETLPDSAVLADTRWQVTSFIMQHIAYEDRHLYSKLLSDHRPHVAETGRKFQAELADLLNTFVKHAQYWTPGRIAADWGGFRSSVHGIVGAMLARMDKEERGLFLLATDADIDFAVRAAPSTNWTRDAFAIKDSIVKGTASTRAGG